MKDPAVKNRLEAFSDVQESLIPSYKDVELESNAWSNKGSPSGSQAHLPPSQPEPPAPPAPPQAPAAPPAPPTTNQGVPTEEFNAKPASLLEQIALGKNLKKVETRESDIVNIALEQRFGKPKTKPEASSTNQETTTSKPEASSSNLEASSSKPETTLIDKLSNQFNKITGRTVEEDNNKQKAPDWDDDTVDTSNIPKLDKGKGKEVINTQSPPMSPEMAELASDQVNKAREKMTLWDRVQERRRQLGEDDDNDTWTNWIEVQENRDWMFAQLKYTETKLANEILQMIEDSNYKINEKTISLMKEAYLEKLKVPDVIITSDSSNSSNEGYFNETIESLESKVQSVWKAAKNLVSSNPSTPKIGDVGLDRPSLSPLKELSSLDDTMLDEIVPLQDIMDIENEMHALAIEVTEENRNKLINLAKNLDNKTDEEIVAEMEKAFPNKINKIRSLASEKLSNREKESLIYLAGDMSTYTGHDNEEYIERMKNIIKETTDPNERKTMLRNMASLDTLDIHLTGDNKSLKDIEALSKGNFTTRSLLEEIKERNLNREASTSKLNTVEEKTAEVVVENPSSNKFVKIDNYNIEKAFDSQASTSNLLNDTMDLFNDSEDLLDNIPSFNDIKLEFINNENDRIIKIDFNKLKEQAQFVLLRTNDNYFARINLDLTSEDVISFDWGHAIKKLDTTGIRTDIYEVVILDREQNKHFIYKNAEYDNLQHKRSSWFSK